MLILRYLGWAFLALAFISLSYDVLVGLFGSNFSFTLLGEAWYVAHSESLNLLQAVVERYITPYLWAYFFFPILKTPIVVICTLLGGACVLTAALKRTDDPREH